MKPYYEHSGITLFHGDCREILPSLGVFGTCLSDPPYGMNNNADYSRFSGGNTKRGVGQKHENIKGDDEPFDPSFLLSYPKVILWGANHFWNRLPSGGCLVWIKRHDKAFGTFLSDAEIAYVSGIQGIYCFRKRFSGSLKAIDAGFDPYAGSAHPNQKPVSLMEWALKFGEGDVIDPFTGSGTILVAAKNLGRKATGIEIEERYCEITAKRLQQEVFDFGGTE